MTDSQLTRRRFIRFAGTAPMALAASHAQAAALPLSARQVVERIQKNLGVPWNPASTRDTFKAGNPDTPVTGIATTFMSTLDVLHRARAAGQNLVITHEPTFWSDTDATKDLADDPLYQLKRDFIARNNLVVWRMHDHVHAWKPDKIFVGWNKVLGWEKYVLPDDPDVYVLPPTTLESLARHLATRLKTRSIRVIGDPRLPVSKVGRGPHVIEGNVALLSRVDAIVVFEGREQEVIEYVRDTVLSGQPKGMVLTAHESGEEAGMDEFALWLRTIVTEVPVAFLSTREAFWRVPFRALGDGPE